MAEQVVELQPGESKLVSFEAVPTEARTYQVTVDGLTGGFKAVAAAVALPFTFSNVSVSTRTCPVATAWKTPTFTCDVVNNNLDSVTHTLNMKYRRFSVKRKTWYGPFEEREGLIELTLAPGESYLYKFEGYHEQWDDPGDWECDPQMGSTYDWEFWLEDELGNKSGIATART